MHLHTSLKWIVFILIWNDCPKIIVSHLTSLKHLFKWLPLEETLFKWLSIKQTLFKQLPVRWTLFKQLAVKWTLFKPLPVYDDWKLSLGECLKSLFNSLPVAVKWTLFKPLPVYDDWKLSLGVCLKTLFNELPVGSIVKTHPISLKSRGEMNLSLTFTLNSL